MYKFGRNKLDHSEKKYGLPLWLCTIENKLAVFSLQILIGGDFTIIDGEKIRPRFWLAFEGVS